MYAKVATCGGWQPETVGLPKLAVCLRNVGIKILYTFTKLYTLLYLTHYENSEMSIPRYACTGKEFLLIYWASVGMAQY